MILIQKLVLWIQESRIIPNCLRVRLLRIGGVERLGNNTAIRCNCYFTGRYVTIGDNCFLNNFCKLYSHNTLDSSIEIGNNVVVGMNVVFCTHTHDVENQESRAGRSTKLAPIKVGCGSWIGANALILSGVTIGSGCVIAAGAVVISDCISNGLYGGVPARLIKALN